MANLEEKGKAFLGDRKKSEAIANDEKFLGAVSSRTANTKTITKEFGKLGLPLSETEEREAKNTTEKPLNTPLEKLGDIELKNVSGGIKGATLWNIEGATAGISLAAGVGGLGCWIAGKVCRLQAQKATLAGDQSGSEKFTKAVKGLDYATAACLGVTGVSALTGVIAHKIPGEDENK